ncbi:GNAT acetyltransferase 2-domain-containing protein [Phakopsora pachyrhizi]|uniref:RNA cytidine acetyltransferase n=1 Tax=Phakopsora pachyrhizi TaxID=170000 RepID=A0AAV0BPB4_PHAPC|nr:GNAT acetyltransferase 2-domain-containing protein [Phakopsora pachyrhizi]CAH7687422.1 GNAT acetyltransferase 2-domain-containing protein [Phakopsora pachyrhizi]
MTAEDTSKNQNSSRKRLDPRIQTLIRNNVKTNRRSFFIVLGDKSKDQVVNLHFLLSQARHSARPNVLWCYKKELGFTSNRKKREQKINREVKKGHRDPGEMDPFELFVSLTDIRYTYYKETEKILGQTFGMLVLQDFEALTPNLLARTIETVTGGGIVLLLLNTMSSLKQLYTLSMDAHERFRTEAYNDLVARFNERFLLSLGPFKECLVLDDELNVLPISAAKDITPLEDAEEPHNDQSSGQRNRQLELQEIKEQLKETKPIGDVIQLARTIDQAKTLMEFTSSITEKTLSSTVTLTAARGRGKSAALGMAITVAVAHSYSNIFVTSPSPENLKTLFEFIFKGLKALGYEEHLDYDIHQSTNPEWRNSIVRIDIFRNHRQTIQYIDPNDHQVLGQAELVVIDEAAAIPIGVVKKLIGPYLVFMSSTINGYEGTGRSLSLKLIAQLRELSRKTVAKDSSAPNVASPSQVAESSKTALKYNKPKLLRTLKELRLEEPIRYADGDGVEKWLNGLLCLDVQASVANRGHQGFPHPSKCDLYYVNRDTLFSYHPASEAFLRRMMSLYVASHYKNSPNDLQLMSDSPSQQLYVLLPPIRDEDEQLPEPLAVIQLALEGKISKPSIMASLSRGIKASGDLIPWTISQQFQDEDFPSLSGARIVRIATHPDCCRMGYGTRAIEMLDSFFSGRLVSLNENLPSQADKSPSDSALQPSKSLENGNNIRSRSIQELPALLQRLSERQPEALDYLGVSFGLTPSLFKFWKRLGFLPVYIRQTENELTGEHTCVMLRSILRGIVEASRSPEEWLSGFSLDFRNRFMALLSYKYRNLPSIMCLTILEATNAGDLIAKKVEPATAQELSRLFTPYDLKRLESYSNNMLDYHVILDLLPRLTELYFGGKFNQETKLSGVQSSIILCLGLQRKSVEEIESEIGLPVSHTLALFVKVIRKLLRVIQDVLKENISSKIPVASDFPPLNCTVPNSGSDLKLPKPLIPRAASKVVPEDQKQSKDDELDELKEKQRQLIDSLDLTQYAIGGGESEWAQAEESLAKRSSENPEAASLRVSVANSLSSKLNKRKSANEKTKPSTACDKYEKKHKKRKSSNRRH